MKVKETFEPIPSLDYRYEINLDGVVRNARTGHILKARNVDYHKDRYRFIIGGVEKIRSRASLMHEVHGVIPKKTKAPSVGTLIRKAGEAYSFVSMTAAAKFLARKVYYCYSAIRQKLTARKSEIYGWQIYYREPDQRKPVTCSKANGDCELRRGLK